MRVLVVSNLFPPTFLGGYELGCAQVVRGLRDAGHDVTVVTSNGPEHGIDEVGVCRVLHLPPIYNADRMSLASPEVQEHFQVTARTVNASNLQALATIAEDFNPDVVYLWNLLGIGGLGVLAVLRYLGLPWVWHIMDMIPRQLCAFGSDAVPAVASRFGRFFPGRYIACSTRVAEEIRDGGIDLGRHVRLLPNWVTRNPAARTKFFRGGNLRMIYAVGTLSQAKGTHILIEAASQLRDMGFANFSIDLFGRDPEGHYRAMVHANNLESCVFFRGVVAQDKLLDLYPEYDLFAFPTWEREPMGFAPLEAAAAGCLPLITADCGYSEWMVADVHCLKAQRSAPAFAQRISDVLLGDVDVHSIARRAQRVVTQDFALERLLPQIVEELSLAGHARRIPLGEVADANRFAWYAEAMCHVLVDEAL